MVAVEIRPLPYVTPSRLFALETCFLRAAFDADPRYAAGVFRGPKARLGSASHALLERVSKHELDGIPASERRHRLRDLWECEAKKEGDAAHNSEIERHLGPPERWPGYNIQKARAVASAARILERRDKAPGGPGGARVERFYSAYGGRLRGRADGVYARGGRTEIEDYKTGGIHDETPGAKPVLKRRFRRQLLLYAAMHHDETGKWPATGSVVPLSGPKESFWVDPAEAEEEVRAALSVMASYNEEARAPDVRPESLASPSPSSCRFCGHKLACQPFWEVASPEWSWTGGEAVRGRVLRLATGGTGVWRGEVSVTGGTLAKGVYDITGNRDVPLAEGEPFVATDVRTVEKQGTALLMVTDYTVARNLREEAGALD